MKWLAAIIADGLERALGQFSWGLLEAYGYNPSEHEAEWNDSNEDKRTPEEREADILMFQCAGHL